MVLLHLLHALGPSLGWKLSVAHFNHQLRGRASDADERFIKATARRLKLPCDVGRADVRQQAKRDGVSIEMAARQLRHSFLARCARKRKAPIVVLAQHADDQVELFLMRVLRGAGGVGLSGMKWRSASSADKGVTLVRPLLECRKDELLAFADTLNIRFREDASNRSTDFERNWVRLELLPMLSRRHPGVRRALLRVMNVVQAEADFVGAVARQWLTDSMGQSFAELPVAVQRRIVQEQLIRLNIEPDFEWIELLRTEACKPVSVAPDLCLKRNEDGRILCVDREVSTFSDAYAKLEISERLGSSGQAVFAGLTIEWRVRKPLKAMVSKQQPGVEYFDASRVGKSLELRHWQPGDRFQPIGMTTAAKLQDWFTNRKIPAAQRRQLVLAKTERGEVFWVEGERIGEVAKITSQTRKVLEWRWKRR